MLLEQPSNKASVSLAKQAQNLRREVDNVREQALYTVRERIRELMRSISELEEVDSAARTLAFKGSQEEALYQYLIKAGFDFPIEVSEEDVRRL